MNINNVIDSFVLALQNEDYLKDSLIFKREPIKQDENIEAIFIYMKSAKPGTVSVYPYLNVYNIVLTIKIIAAGRNRKTSENDSITTKRQLYSEAIRQAINKCLPGNESAISNVYDIALESEEHVAVEKIDVAKKEYESNFLINFYTYN